MIALVKDTSVQEPIEATPFAKVAERLHQSPLRDILPQVSRPGVISLALGMPASELFPRQQFLEAMTSVLSNHRALQYGEPSRTLKKHIVRLMEQRGVVCSEEQVVLTAGAQQALSLVTQLLVDPGEAVLTEDIVYDGLQMVLETHGAKVLTVPSSLESGIDLNAVEDLLVAGARPRFLYVIPEGHNPLGVSMAPERRERLLELARRFEVPVLEDDAYGFLYYDGDRPTRPLAARDDKWVFYLGSFSKILAPALRLGWIVVPAKLVSKVETVTSHLAVLKQAADFDTTNLAQRAVAAYLDSGHFPTHLQAIRDEYRRRRDAMVAALAQHFPHEISWNRPQSGLFLWIELPPGVLNIYDLLRQAIDRESVAFLPGQAFAVTPERRWSTHCMRLSFGNCRAEVIEEGVARLGRVVKSALVGLRRPGAAPPAPLTLLTSVPRTTTRQPAARAARAPAKSDPASSRPKTTTNVPPPQPWGKTG